MAKAKKTQLIKPYRLLGVCLFAFSGTYMVAGILALDKTDGLAIFYILFCFLLLLTSLPLIFFGSFKEVKKYISAIWDGFITSL